jgi:hypothetical protein
MSYTEADFGPHPERGLVVKFFKDGTPDWSEIGFGIPFLKSARLKYKGDRFAIDGSDPEAADGYYEVTYAHYTTNKSKFVIQPFRNGRRIIGKIYISASVKKDGTMNCHHITETPLANKCTHDSRFKMRKLIRTQTGNYNK